MENRALLAPPLLAQVRRWKLVSLSQVSSMLTMRYCYPSSSSMTLANYCRCTKALSVFACGCTFLALT